MHGRPTTSKLPPRQPTLPWQMSGWTGAATGAGGASIASGGGGPAGGGGPRHAPTSASAASTLSRRGSGRRIPASLLDELEVRAPLLRRGLFLGQRWRGRRLAAAGQHVLRDVLRPHGAPLLALDHGGVDRGPRQH